MIRLRVSAQEAKSGPPLSPILGQHQIKVPEFVSRFNTASTEWAPGVPVGVRIHKHNAQQWTLKITPPVLVVQLSGVVRHRKIKRTHLWAILGESPCREQALTLLGTLKSLAYRTR